MLRSISKGTVQLGKTLVKNNISCGRHPLRSCVHTESLRPLSELSSRSYSSSQSEHEDMENLKNNPFYAKYANKISDAQKSDPDEFQSKIEDLDRQKQKEKKEEEERLAEAHKQMMEKRAQQSKPKSLDGVMKMDLLKDKSADEISQLWTEFHTKKDCIFATIPRDEYEEIHRRSLEFSTFLYPMARGQGYEFFLQQFEGNDVHFTPLILYQTHKENAPASLTITHYTDLMEEKGIVLMHGYPDTNFLTQHESQLLALQLKMYYGLQSGLRFNLVRMFNNAPQNFQHMDLIKEFENFKKDALDKKIMDVGTPL